MQERGRPTFVSASPAKAIIIIIVAYNCYNVIMINNNTNNTNNNETIIMINNDTNNTTNNNEIIIIICSIISMRLGAGAGAVLPRSELDLGRPPNVQREAPRRAQPLL